MFEGFEYSDAFKARLIHKLRGMEKWPRYNDYLRQGLAGPDSRVVSFATQLLPEIKYHCGDVQKMRALDFGCGTGCTTVPMIPFFNEVVAFDVDQEGIEIAEQRVREHGLEKKVQLRLAKDVAEIREELGNFDLILANGVLEHIPLSKTGERRRTVRLLFEMLNRPGYLVINDTPNRLWPIDVHSTGLWWIPWMRPGSPRAYRKALKKKRHSDVPTISAGPLGLEEIGAWGATYWELRRYLEGEDYEFLSAKKGHNRHIQYCSEGSRKKKVFDAMMYYSATRFLRMPITAFAPFLTNLIVKKL